MLYIKLTENKQIEEIQFAPAEGFEEISLHDSKLTEYIDNSENSEEIIQKVLGRLDLDMVRVIEDVIDILIDKNVMLFTDLPHAVQSKILFKKQVRNLKENSGSILQEEDEGLHF